MVINDTEDATNFVSVYVYARLSTQSLERNPAKYRNDNTLLPMEFKAMNEIVT